MWVYHNGYVMKLDHFLKDYPIICIYNGIDTSIFKPSAQYDQEIREKYNLGNGILLTAVATAWE